jgi:hypothetical protein
MSKCFLNFKKTTFETILYQEVHRETITAKSEALNKLVKDINPKDSLLGCEPQAVSTAN